MAEDAFLLRGRDARLRGRFKGVLKVRYAGAWVRALAERGVPTLALKGLALAVRYYKDFGLRPMEDIDLLVHAEHVPAALAYLYGERFAPTETIPGACWPPHAGAPNLGSAAVTHGVGFIDPEERQLDLHWSALSTHCGDDADRSFWAHAEPLQLAGGTTRALAPAHEFVHILGHGLRWNSMPSIRWIPDAAMVIARSPAFDWPLFLDEVAARGLGVGIAPALAELAHYDVRVPPAVQAELSRMPASALDRLRLEHSLWPWDKKKSLGVIAFDALRFCEGLGPAAALARMGRYAWFRLAPDGRVASIPGQLLRKLGPRAPR